MLSFQIALMIMWLLTDLSWLVVLHMKVATSWLGGKKSTIASSIAQEIAILNLQLEKHVAMEMMLMQS